MTFKRKVDWASLKRRPRVEWVQNMQGLYRHMGDIVYIDIGRWWGVTRDVQLAVLEDTGVELPTCMLKPKPVTRYEVFDLGAHETLATFRSEQDAIAWAQAKSVNGPALRIIDVGSA
jgi:hypothetical protein